MTANVPGVATKDAATRRRSMRDAVAATTSEEIAALREDWLILRSRYGTATPDADPDFFLDIYHALDEEVRPHVVVFRDDTAPYALIVGRLARKPITSRVGYFKVPSPHLQCLEIVYGGLITDGKPCSRTAVAGYLETLLSERAVDVLSVHHLNVDHPLAEVLAQGLTSHRRVVCLRDLHWSLNLLDPATGERLMRHSRKTRSTFRRKDRKLVREFGTCVALRVFRYPSEAGEFVKYAGSITSETYQNALNTGVQDTERWRMIVQALADTGRFRGYLLYGRDEPIAYVVGAVFNQSFTLFATGFLPAYCQLSPGSVLLVRVLDGLASDGVTTFDFGFGDAEYKRLHGSRCWEEVTVRLYASGWRSALASHMERAAMVGSRFAARVARSTGMLRRLKRGWRGRLERTS